MTNLFRNASPDALTREQAVALEKKRLAERRRNKRQAEELAAQGRGGDTEIAHVTPGELVLPDALQTPELLAALRQAAADQGISLDMLRVGNAKNRFNPNTGAPEFAFESIPESSRDLARDFPGVDAQLEKYDITKAPIETSGLFNGPINIGRQPTNPAHVNAFFDAYDKPITDLANEMNVPPNLLLGLVAGESSWGQPPMGKNNLFGFSASLGRPYDYATPQASIDAFRKSQWFSRLQNKTTPDAFVDELVNNEGGKKKYNTVNKNYDKFVYGLIDTVNRRRPIWEQTR